MEGLPASMRQFRAWTSLELGLVTIGSSATTDPNVSPHNGKLIERAYDAMKRIASIQATKKLQVYVPRGRQIEELLGIVDELRERNRRLASEVLEFMHKHDVALRDREAAERERDVALKDLQALRLEFIEATRAGPRRVK